MNCLFRPQCPTCAFGWAKLGFMISFLQIYRPITHEVEINFVQRQGIFGGSGGTGMTAQVSTIKFLQLNYACFCMQELTLGNNQKRILGNNWEIIGGNNLKEF